MREESSASQKRPPLRFRPKKKTLSILFRGKANIYSRFVSSAPTPIWLRMCLRRKKINKRQDLRKVLNSCFWESVSGNPTFYKRRVSYSEKKPSSVRLKLPIPSIRLLRMEWCKYYFATHPKCPKTCDRFFFISEGELEKMPEAVYIKYHYLAEEYTKKINWGDDLLIRKIVKLFRLARKCSLYKGFQESPVYKEVIEILAAETAEKSEKDCDHRSVPKGPYTEKILENNVGVIKKVVKKQQLAIDCNLNTSHPDSFKCTDLKENQASDSAERSVKDRDCRSIPKEAYTAMILQDNEGVMEKVVKMEQLARECNLYAWPSNRLIGLKNMFARHQPKMFEECIVHLVMDSSTKDYDGRICMECKIDAKLAYPDLSTVFHSLRQAIDEKIRELSNRHIIYPAVDFQEKEPGVANRSIKIEFPGLRKAGWTPDQWEHARFKIVNASTDGTSNQKSLTAFMHWILKKEAGIPKRGIKIEEIPVLRKVGCTPDQWGHSGFKIVDTSIDGTSNEKSSTAFMSLILKAMHDSFDII